MVIEDDDRCPGCQRHEVHKYCPAYGTAFYMSGVAYDEELEKYVRRQVFLMGYEDNIGNIHPKQFSNNILHISYIAGYLTKGNIEFY